MDERAFFMMGYGKNERANVERKELIYFRDYGAILLALDEATLDLALARGELTEIGR